MFSAGSSAYNSCILSLHAMAEEPNRLYTLDEVSRMTGFSKDKLREEIDTGDLATTGEANADGFRISGTELERWWSGVEKKEDELYSEDTENDE